MARWRTKDKRNYRKYLREKQAEFWVRQRKRDKASFYQWKRTKARTAATQVEAGA